MKQVPGCIPCPVSASSVRQRHPAWLLLASRRAPLTPICLEAPFERRRDGVPFDEAVQALAQHLRQLPRGRLEQEFLPADTVARALRDWWARP